MSKKNRHTKRHEQKITQHNIQHTRQNSTENIHIQKSKKDIHIQGMHCVSCEMLIKQAVETLDGVTVTHISANQWMMCVELPHENILPSVHKCICDAWYTVSENEQMHTPPKIHWEHLLQSIIIVGVLAFVFYKFDVVQYLPSTTGDNLSLWVALLIWIVASVSTCLAIVGSIVIWFSEYLDTSKWTWHHIKVQLSFHAWRIGGFFILGWLLWLIGKAIAISLTTTTILTIIVGLVVLWMWLHLLHILPNISSLGIHLPKSWSNHTLTTKNPVFAPLIGALTFFLPCWFTLSMQLIAINTGNFWQWWLAMSIFALWTAPVLLAVWLWSSYIKEKKFALMHTIIGTLIVFFGIFMITNGRRMLWWFSVFTQNTQDTNQQLYDTDYERRDVWYDGLRLVPEIITLTAGRNYELVVTPSDNGKWCMVTQTIPWLDRRVSTIIQWQPIIYNFTNIQAGTYYVVCWTMWMYQWQIVVQ